MRIANNFYLFLPNKKYNKITVQYAPKVKEFRVSASIVYSMSIQESILFQRMFTEAITYAIDCQKKFTGKEVEEIYDYWAQEERGFVIDGMKAH